MENILPGHISRLQRHYHGPPKLELAPHPYKKFKDAQNIENKSALSVTASGPHKSWKSADSEH